MKNIHYQALWIMLTLLLNSYIQAQSKPDKKPNIIFILTDDLGWADLGCYGNPYIKTPNIDSLARLGIRCTQAYTTSPICSPSRAAILTGQHPARLKLTNFLEGIKMDSSSPLLPADFIKELPAETVTIAEILQQQGYHTGLIGKWHLGQATHAQPMYHGFNEEIVSNNKIFYYDFTLTRANQELDRSVANENLTDRLTDEAINFLRRNKDTSFYLHLTHFAPHLILQPKPEKLPPYYFTYEAHSKGRYDPQYAATIATLDDNIGRIMKAMQELDLWKNTLLVFTSDNGGVHVKELGVKPTDNHPLREGKSHVYEGGIRIPLLLVWKDQFPSKTQCDALLVNTDFFYSFATLAGAEVKASPDGQDIFPLLSGKEKNSNRTYWWYYPHFSNQQGRPAAAIRKNQYKLIVHLEKERKELYDIQKDPGEKVNLAPNKPKLVMELYAELQKRLKETAANVVKPNPSFHTKNK